MKTVSTLLLAGLALVAADTFPVIEENYDFIGNDVANMKGPADKCADFCKANDKCHAYTWSNYQSGTCWLKSKRDAVQFTPGLKSAVMVQLPQKQCSLLQDVDFVDNDIYNVKAGKAEDCCDLCKKLDRCRVYAWSDLNGGTCWFKSQLGTAIHKPGVKAGFAFPYDTPVEFFQNTDYEGHDIGAKPAAKAELCVDICTNFPGCRAFAWNNYQGGMCWLKAAKGNQISKDGVTAAVIQKPIAKATLQVNKDFRDNDARSVNGIKDGDDCVQICADYSDCHAVVWTDYMQGTCWLKHQAGIVEDKDKAKAYTLV